jgi:hypothetical protein
MTRRNKFLITSAVILTAIGYSWNYFTKIPDSYVLNKECLPNDWTQTVRSILIPDAFWKSQANQGERSIRHLELFARRQLSELEELLSTYDPEARDYFVGKLREGIPEDVAVHLLEAHMKIKNIKIETKLKSIEERRPQMRSQINICTQMIHLKYP